MPVKSLARGKQLSACAGVDSTGTARYFDTTLPSLELTILIALLDASESGPGVAPGGVAPGVALGVAPVVTPGGLATTLTGHHRETFEK